MSTINIPGRASFCHVFQPAQFEQGDPKYQCTVLVPKTDVARIKAIRATIEEVGKKKWGAKWEEMKNEEGSQVMSRALRNGNLKKKFAGYEDHVFVVAGNKTRPAVVDRDRSPLVEADGRPYSGCYIVQRVEFWAQDNKFGKFINASLKGVQFVRDGEGFGGGAPATADDFEDLGDDGEAVTQDDNLDDMDDLLG